jgi:hypothetical protein
MVIAVSLLLSAACAAEPDLPRPVEGTRQQAPSLFVLENEVQCTPALDERCRSRAQSLLRSEKLIARSVCRESLGAPVCAAGAHCSGDAGDWPPPACICAPGVICPPDHICASEGTDGPLRCYKTPA